MAASLWSNFLHLLKSLWIFLCNLGHRSKRDSTTVLPLVSPPIAAQGIVINICAPPEDLLADTLPTSNSPNFPRKQEFLRTPSSSRHKPRHRGDEKHRRRHAASEFYMPNIHVENRDDPQFKSFDVQKPRPCVPVSVVSQPPPVPPAPDDPGFILPLSSSSKPSAVPSNTPCEALSLDTVVSTPPGAPVEPNRVPEPRVPQIIDDGQMQHPMCVESLGETLKMAFEPVTYASSALSAVSECTFWDVPSNNTACMVPLPLYTSTPPRHCSRPSTDQNTTRLSLLPYTDLFDFSMYNSRVSQYSSDEFLFSNLPPDLTTPLAPGTEVETTPHASEIAYRDQYRSSAYSKPTGTYSYKSSTTLIKSGSATNRFSSSSRKHLREISLNLVAFNSPLTKRMSTESAAGFRDSSFSRYSQSSASSGDLSVKSLKDIGTRLHAACDDLSRCLWTDEEFMKLLE